MDIPSSLKPFYKSIQECCMFYFAEFIIVMDYCKLIQNCMESKKIIKLYEENGDEFEQIIIPESIHVPLVIPPKSISFQWNY